MMKTAPLVRPLVGPKRNPLAVLLLAMIGLAAPTAHAQMLLNIVEDNSDLVFTWSGNWSVWNFPNSNGDYTQLKVNSLTLTAINGSASYVTDNYPGDADLPLGWNAITGGTMSGDAFGWDNQGHFYYLYAPLGYTASDPISGSAIFANKSYSDLGVTDGQSGTITFNSGNYFQWSIGTSAVPEPGTYAAIVGFLSLCGTVIHRRRRGETQPTLSA